MSTKIYVARKVSINKLNDFIDYIRPQIYDYAQDIVGRLMPEVQKEHIDKIKKEYDWKSENLIRFESSINLLKEIAKSTYRDPLDITFGLNIWLNENYAYIIPVGELINRKELKYPRYSKDYSYWNNTDKPKNVTNKEWEERCNTWQKLNCGSGKSSHNARRLYHSIIDLNALYGDFDFENEMGKRILRNKRTSQ